MTTNNTLGYLKKRILDTLDECAGTNAVFVSDGNREVLISRMPDAINSSLIRMFESLPISNAGAVIRIIRHSEAECTLKDGKYRFSVKGTKAAIVMGYFGDGTAIIENSRGESVFETECTGTGKLLYKRETVSLSDGEVYTLKTVGNLCVRDFAVYETDNDDRVQSYAPKGFCSAQLPEDFDRFISIGNGNEKCEGIEICDGYAYLPSSMCKGAQTLNTVYMKKPPVIFAETDDSFVFELSPLAVEALICLAASGLCRDNENAMYTRLFYKYMDLSEGLCTFSVGSKRKNSFYKGFSARR